MLLRRLLNSLCELADVGHLVAAVRAVERVRLAHELRLRALRLRLEAAWLIPSARRENLVLARELDELVTKFTALSRQ